MLTAILKRTEEPKIIQLTQENIMRELSSIIGSEMLLVDTWKEGITKVRTPYFCLLEPDCTLSANYLSSNAGLMKKASTGIGNYRGGGNLKVAMISSCLGVDTFANRIYNYRVEEGPWRHEGGGKMKNYEVVPNRSKNHTSLYDCQVGFVPGSVIRHSAITDIIGTFDWDDKNLVRLSFNLSVYLWATNRRVNANPNTTYVSTNPNLEEPKRWALSTPGAVENIFRREGIS